MSYELSEFCDLTEKGRLNGHKSLITAMNVLQGTPIVLTIQDEGTIKLWDIPCG
jgi:WD40 repeat protein